MLRPPAALNSVLVVGGDGEIGRALTGRLAGDGVAAWTTSRRPAAGGERTLSLDLERPAEWPALPAVDAAVLCAAVSSIADCTRDPARANAVNVAAVEALARRLVAAGTRVVFLSSNQVFDGAVARRARDDTPCPVSAYGRQKAEAEARLLPLGAAVLRLTKVLSPASPLLAGWRRALAAGEAVTPFANFPLAPVSLDYAVDAICRILVAGEGGIFQASAADDVTYVAAAERLALALRADPALVRPVAADARRLGFDELPRFSSLEMSREESLGLQPPRAAGVIAAAVSALRG